MASLAYAGNGLKSQSCKCFCLHTWRRHGGTPMREGASWEYGQQPRMWSHCCPMPPRCHAPLPVAWYEAPHASHAHRMHLCAHMHAGSHEPYGGADSMPGGDGADSDSTGGPGGDGHLAGTHASAAALRASLQSLQQLLPVRPSVNANLLSQFAAAATVGPGAAGGAPNQPAGAHYRARAGASPPRPQPGWPPVLGDTGAPAGRTAGGDYDVQPWEAEGSATGQGHAEAAANSGSAQTIDEHAAAPAWQAYPAAYHAEEEPGLDGVAADSGTAAAEACAGLLAGPPDDHAFRELAAAYTQQQLLRSEPSAPSVSAGSEEDMQVLHALLVQPAGQGHMQQTGEEAAAVDAAEDGDVSVQEAWEDYQDDGGRVLHGSPSPSCGGAAAEPPLQESTSPMQLQRSGSGSARGSGGVKGIPSPEQRQAPSAGAAGASARSSMRYEPLQQQQQQRHSPPPLDEWLTSRAQQLQDLPVSQQGTPPSPGMAAQAQGHDRVTLRADAEHDMGGGRASTASAATGSGGLTSWQPAEELEAVVVYPLGSSGRITREDSEPAWESSHDDLDDDDEQAMAAAARADELHDMPALDLSLGSQQQYSGEPLLQQQCADTGASGGGTAAFTCPAAASAWDGDGRSGVGVATAAPAVSEAVAAPRQRRRWGSPAAELPPALPYPPCEAADPASSPPRATVPAAPLPAVPAGRGSLRLLPPPASVPAHDAPEGAVPGSSWGGSGFVDEAEHCDSQPQPATMQPGDLPTCSTSADKLYEQPTASAATASPGAGRSPPRDPRVTGGAPDGKPSPLAMRPPNPPDMVAGPGGVAFSISLRATDHLSGASWEDGAAVWRPPLQPAAQRLSPHRGAAAASSPSRGGIGVAQGGAAMPAAGAGLAMHAGHGVDGHSWERLNKQLREAGFSGLMLQGLDGNGEVGAGGKGVYERGEAGRLGFQAWRWLLSQAQAGRRPPPCRCIMNICGTQHGYLPASCLHRAPEGVLHPARRLCAGGSLAPDAAAVYRSLGGVLEQYVRRNRLVQELLAATEAAARNEQEQVATIRCGPAQLLHQMSRALLMLRMIAQRWQQ